VPRPAIQHEQSLVNAATPLPDTAKAAPVSEARLRRVVTAHFDALWRMLRRLGVPQRDLDDAVQEVILVLSRRLSEVPASSERSFVLGTGCRVASTFRRTIRRRRESDYEPHSEVAEDDGLSPEALVEQRRARVMLDAVLEKLEPDFRAVFVLYELERCTLVEIAETLGIPQGTAASRLRRARAQFQGEVTRLERRLAGGKR